MNWLRLGFSYRGCGSPLKARDPHWQPDLFRS